VSNGSSPSAAMAGFAPGARISGYLLEEQIGRGGMAVVFRARDERLNRLVALKILAPVLAEDDAFRQRFILESQAAAAVDDPNIIPVYEAGEADRALFIATRLVRGGDLRTLVAQHGPLSPIRAEWILSAVASALDAAHGSGLIHRDVKPANMLLETRSGRPDHVYLTDFGVSKAALDASGLTGTGQFIGTVDYAAPEQIQGWHVDGRTDQYALGCSAFELLCGRPPFFGRQLVAAMYAQVSEPPPAASSLRQRLPGEVDDVFARVLAKAPEDRYPSCEDFASALRVALGVQAYSTGGVAGGQPVSMASADDGGEATVDPVAARLARRLSAGGAGIPADAGGTAIAGSEVGVGPVAGAAAPGAAGGGTRPGATDPSAVAAGAGGPRLVLPGGWRSLRVLAGAVALVLVVGGAAAWLVLGRAPAAAAVPYQFRRQSFPGGLAIAQRWQLTGRDGTSLQVSITASNSTSETKTVQLEEPIPATVASSLHAVRFRPPAKVLAAARTAVWENLQLPANGAAHLSYQVSEPPGGATEARLAGWVSAFETVAYRQDLQPITAGGVLQAITVLPRTLTLDVGQDVRLRLQGTLSSGKNAPRADLSGAIWQSANAGVADVDFRGEVFARSAGVTQVNASVGPISALVTVTVLPAGGPPGGIIQSSPPWQSSSPPASQSPSPSPSASVSPSGSPPVSPTPTDSPTASASAGTPVSELPVVLLAADLVARALAQL
jgi:Protein kinase domain